jgi:hydroxybutyrate-dimer hydrolase
MRGEAKLMGKRIAHGILIAAALATSSEAAWSDDGGTDAKYQSPQAGKYVTCTYYDGEPNDLLTGGLGSQGLASSTPPGLADPENPTAEELRTLAIYGNYRALIDTAPGGGYGSLTGPAASNLFGPVVGNRGQFPFNDENGNDGRIPGWECLTYAGPPSGRVNVTLMVQVPDWFDEENPCIVTAASSGSRGVYGAIGTSGDWGLKQRCAVAYTDKGTGTGAHNLQDNTINLIDGLREDADAAAKASNFTAPINDQQRRRFNERTPNRFAFKHAHSRLNPEADWGTNVLQAIEFAFDVLNRKEVGLGGRFTKHNTIVIASSVSNGAGAAVLAAEQDVNDLIDGFAGTEPNVNPNVRRPLAIKQGNGPPYTEPGKPLYDYYGIYNLYQGCANLAYPFGVLLNFTSIELGENVCTSLQQQGLLSTDTVAEQADEAQSKINAYGILPEQNIIQPGDWYLQVSQAIGVTYANTYSRSHLQERLCGYSFGATDSNGSPTALPEAAEQALFGASNGIPPTGGVNLINDLSVGGPLANLISKSPSTNRQDQNLDGSLCLRSLWTGRDPVNGERLRGRMQALHKHLRAGIRQILASGDLNGKPALIAAGRSDQIIPPNHGSRAYFGLNQQVEGSSSKLSYIEVTNAQHLDVLNGLPDFGARYIPLHHYLVEVLNLMYDHLTAGVPLPPSQVVTTKPRGGAPGGPVPPITTDNLPPIEPNPPASARITFADGVVHIPE